MLDRIKTLVNKASIISFDIFDTAVLRTVYKPTDLFQIVLENYRYLYGHLNTNFPNLRIEAERKARKKIWSEHQQTEITLDLIYDLLCSDYNINKESANKLKELEIGSEESLTIQNPFIYKIYKYCLEKETRIIFTSDIYLPERLIHKILDKTGYENKDKVFISSSWRATKAAGDLYRCLLQEMHCQPEQVLHIGDNYDSDIKKARSFGINTFFYKKCRKVAENDASFRRNILEPFQQIDSQLESSLLTTTIINKYYANRGKSNNFIKQQDSFWYNLGYCVVGMLYLSFADWVRQQAINDEIDTLYFLARDGYIMQTVYDRLKLIKPEAPESCYIYSSRRALNIPAITKLQEKDIDFLVSGTSRLTVRQFLARIGLEVELYKDEIKEAGFSSCEDIVRTGLDYGRLRKLYRLLSSQIEEIAFKERQALESYLQESGLLNRTKKVGLVDIGWHGSMQCSLDTLLTLFGAKPTIKGYYLGTFPPAQKVVQEGYCLSGFLCHLGKPQEHHDLVKECVEFFEFIHNAPHGSVVNFKFQDHNVLPQFDNDVREDKRFKAQKIQEGALDFIEDIFNVWSNVSSVKISKEAAIAPLARLLRKPTTKEAVQIGNVLHCEGFGDVYKKRFIARPPGLWTKLFRPDILLKEYRQAFWKKGYLKRCLSLK